MTTIAELPTLAVIEGQKLNLSSLDHAVENIINATATTKPFSVFTLNADHVVKLRKDPSFKEAYKNAHLITADGWPIAWLARKQGANMLRTTGADLVVPLCEKAAEKSIPVYLLGATDESLSMAADYLRNKFPTLDICGIHSPSFGFDPDGEEAKALIEEVANSRAGLCFVAMGAPRQELFAARAVEAETGPGYLCIGAALDFLSGHQSRAPKLFRDNGAEWLWRLGTNPRRLAKRYADCALVLGDIAVLTPLRKLISRRTKPNA